MKRLQNLVPLLAVAVLLSTLACVGTPVQSPVAETTGPSHLPELDYLLGEWTLHSYSRDDSGKFVEADVTTSYRARTLYDGLSILAEFYGEDLDGFYGVHLISRSSSGDFVHYYLNARAGRRLEFSGRMENDEYYLSRAGGYGGGDFLYREIDSEIGPDSFVKRIYQSDDNGVTWVEGNFYFRFERVAGG